MWCRLLAALVLSWSLPMEAAAQDGAVRPFVFSVSAPAAPTRQATAQVDAGVGAETFGVTEGSRPLQRFGVQAAAGRITLVAHVGLSDAATADLQPSPQGEVLYSLLQRPASRASLAVGVGLRHEAAGTTVLLARVAAGRTWSARWRTDANALFERPYGTGRDAIDVITTLGLSRAVGRALHAGVELIGEDLEGFWESDEAEGGARLLVGPSLRLAPRSKRWQVSAAGGPILHPSTSARLSTATRDLRAPTGRGTYGARVALAYRF